MKKKFVTKESRALRIRNTADKMMAALFKNFGVETRMNATSTGWDVILSVGGMGFGSSYVAICVTTKGAADALARELNKKIKAIKKV